MSIKKYIFSATFGIALLIPSTAFAHVTVKPGEVGVAKFETFNVGVPSEKDIPTVSLRLVLPDGLKKVTPGLKAGWTIDVKRVGEGEEAKATEIIWSGNEIPAHFREDFTFSAQAPEKEVELQWKAYQTYSDGVVVAWDLTSEAQPKKPDGSPDFSTAGPYSVTKVVNDLQPVQKSVASEPKSDRTAFWLSLIAVILAAASLLRKPDEPKPKP